MNVTPLSGDLTRFMKTVPHGQWVQKGVCVLWFMFHVDCIIPPNRETQRRMIPLIRPHLLPSLCSWDSALLFCVLQSDIKYSIMMFVPTQTVQEFRMFPLTPDPVQWNGVGYLRGKHFPEYLMFWSFLLCSSDYNISMCIYVRCASN